MISAASALLAATVLQMYAASGPADAADPALTVEGASVTVDEGQVARNGGNYEDTDGYPVTITASAGTVTQTGEGQGTWSWSYDASDGPAGGQTVTVTSTRVEGGKAPDSVRFPVTVKNVAPSAILDAPASVGAGGSFPISLKDASDPSPEDAKELRYAFDCGDGAGYGATGPASSVVCGAGSALGQKSVKAKVVDKDGGEREYSATVAVKDVNAPVIRPLSPKNKAKISDTTPVIRASVRDDFTQLSRSNLKVYVNGKVIPKSRFRYNGKTDVLTYNSRVLSPGNKVVKIVATDAASNVASKTWRFTIKR